MNLFALGTYLKLATNDGASLSAQISHEFDGYCHLRGKSRFESKYIHLIVWLVFQHGVRIYIST